MVSRDKLARAAGLIRAGRLVAFPTETVYGLGANALDARAVRRIFELKGRPPSSPLIVHVDSIAAARELVTEWPARAQALADEYWPGPLTIVLPKRPHVPDEVTAGLPTVGVRVPAHPIALALIREAGVPVAAPSANRFTELSPTTAAHVHAAFGDAIEMVLDGGPTDVGIESTVISLAQGPEPVLLRPGIVTFDAIRRAADPRTGAHPSPGMHHRHYSPRTRLVLVENGALPASGRGAYMWWKTEAAASASIRMPAGAREYAALLYLTLHELDAQGFDWIAVERPPRTPEWAGINDRLERAAQ
jgi:L-threonylcarbamoyladenylate synthase